MCCPAMHAVFPAKWYPAWAIEAEEGYLKDYGDPLVKLLHATFPLLLAASTTQGSKHSKQILRVQSVRMGPTSLLQCVPRM